MAPVSDQCPPLKSSRMFVRPTWNSVVGLYQYETRKLFVNRYGVANLNCGIGLSIMMDLFGL